MRMPSMYSLLAILLVAAGALVAIAQQPPGGVQPKCGYVGDDTACEGCTNRADNCSCEAGNCFTLHRVCYKRPVSATSSNDPCSKRLRVRYGPCWWRNRCVNGNGEDGGACSGSCQSDSVTKFEEPGHSQRYYDETGVCDPDHCVQ